MDLFLGTFSVFRSIDPERLGDKPFHLTYNIENCVLGKGFRYFVQYDRTTDLVTFDYIYTGKKEFQSVAIPLRDFATGVILSAEEMIGEILNISTVCRDASYRIFRADLDIIKDWYREVYGEDATHTIIRTGAPANREIPNSDIKKSPGHIQLIWNRNELEDRIRTVSAIHYDPETCRGFEMTFHLFIGDVDVINGATTFFDFLFPNINLVFQLLDPEHIDPETMHFSSDVPEVSGPGFEFMVTLLDDHETILVEYMSGPINYHAQTTAPLKGFAIAVVQGNEEFLREVREVWPEVIHTDEYRGMADEISTLREWYCERYHEELPYPETIP
jgi:hypothetical protein